MDKINKNDKKINLTYVRFDIVEFKRTNKSALTSTAQDFFHSLNEFAKIHNTDYVDIYMVDDQIQNIKTDTCGLFQLCFYINLFILNLLLKTKHLIYRKFIKLNLSNLLNELFSTNTVQNEEIVENFALEHDITRN